MTGIDNSKDLIAIAKEKSQKLPIIYFISDAAKLKDLKSNTFDRIVSNMAFMGIKDVANTIKECSRVLKKDGYLIFSMVNPLFAEFERKKSKNIYYLKLLRY
jgi:ubiquinone/menaquinone biosynthesis C-methylase UbiE